MMLLALKIALVVSVAGLLLFVAEYSRLTRGACWRDPVGQTIIITEVFLLGTLVPLLLAAFWHLSPFENEIGSWCLIGFLFAGGVAVFWRTVVFERVYRRGKRGNAAGEDAPGRLPAPEGVVHRLGAQRRHLRPRRLVPGDVVPADPVELGTADAALSDGADSGLHLFSGGRHCRFLTPFRSARIRRC